MGEFQPTAFPELNAVLLELITALQAALDEDFLGAYLQGSFAVGDYDQHSDVDFAIVTEKELPGGKVKALQLMHGRIFDLDSTVCVHSNFRLKILALIGVKTAESDAT